MSTATPLEMFLPNVSATDGPFRVLGVAPERCTGEAVDAALRDRLAMIDAHRFAHTPEADEVRATVHTAAAQLRDPRIRAAAFERYAPHVAMPAMDPAPARDGRGAMETRAAPSGGERATAGVFNLPPDDEAYRDLVVRVLIQCGGWNERSKAQLAAITHLHGRPIRHLIAALRLVVVSGPARRHRPVLRASGADAERSLRFDRSLAPVSAAPPRRRARVFLQVATALLLLNSVVMAGLLLHILRDRVGQSRGVDPLASGAPGPGVGGVDVVSGADALREAGSSVVMPMIDEPAGRLAALRGAIIDLPRDPSRAMRAFERQVGGVASRWSDEGGPMLQAMHSAVSDFVATAGREDPAEAMRAIDALAAASDPIVRLTADPLPEQVLPAAWSIAMLSRLDRDRDLPETVEAALRRRLAPFRELASRVPGSTDLGNSFDAGLALALRALAARLIPNEQTRGTGAVGERWEAWTQAADAMASRNPAFGIRARVDALESLLIDGPALNASPATLEAARVVAGSIDWLDPVAARRVVRWIDDAEVPEGELATVVGWISSSMPDRVPRELIVASSALPAERVRARDGLALALGVAIAPSSEFDESLVERGVTLIAMGSRPGGVSGRGSDAEVLLEASAMASWNEAAAHRWNQDRAAADAALERASAEGVRRAIAAARSVATAPRAVDLSRITAPAAGEDGAWAVDAIDAENERDALIGLLNQLFHSEGIRGPADAGVLVDYAINASSEVVREAAHRAVRRFSDDPFVLAAMLEETAVGRRSRDRFLVDLYEDIAGVELPFWNDPRFALEMRRAMVARHIRLLTEAITPTLDDSAALLAETYARRVETVRRAAGLPERAEADVVGVGDRPDAVLAARALSETFQAVASRGGDTAWTVMPLARIVERREARAALAGGVVQRFAVEQLTAAEMLAYIVSWERPALSEDVRAVLVELGARRRNATSVTEQILAAEVAIGELWLMRLGYDDARGTTREMQ